MKRILILCFCLLTLSGFSQTTNKSVWKLAAQAVTPIPTNSYYKPFEIDITEYAIYGSGNHLGGGIRGQYWTSVGIGAGLDLAYYNHELTYSSISLQGRTVLGPVSFGLDVGTGTDLSNPKQAQAQTGFEMTYQTNPHNIDLKFIKFTYHPRFFYEFQNITGQVGNRFLFGFQQTF